MSGSRFRIKYPAPGFEYLEVHIPRIPDYGMGRLTTIVKANALRVPFPITCGASSKPEFQIVLSVFPRTKEVLVLLGRVDNSPPITYGMFDLPRAMDLSRSHTILVVFSNWTVEKVVLDERRLQRHSRTVDSDSDAQRYVAELQQISARLHSQASHGSTAPPLESVYPVIGPPISFFQVQKTVLEDLFGTDWFEKLSHKTELHPAYERWRLCKEMIDLGGNIPFPAETNRLRSIVRLLTDNQFIVVCTGGPLSTFSLGSLANYGDQEVQTRIRAVIRDPLQYMDVLTELSFAAFHLSKKHVVQAHETPGYPDFRIVIPGWKLPLAVDCKRLRSDSSEERIGAVIKKANKQVKMIEQPCYGLAVLDVSDKVNTSTQLSDEIPPEITELTQRVRRAVSKHNTAISAVLMTWDDFAIMEIDGSIDGFLSICLRKRSVLVKHAEPQVPLDENINDILVGNTVLVGVRLTENLDLTQLFVWRPI